MAKSSFSQEGHADTDPLHVGSVEKGMRVLHAFREGSSEALSLTELVGITGMGKSAVQRFTHTWERLGYLAKNPRTRRYQLTPRVVELGYLFLRNDRLVGLSAPHLVALRDRCGLAVNLSVLAREDSCDMIYLLRLPSPELTLDEILPGRRMPAWCNSAGRMLLAQLDDDALAATLAAVQPQAYTTRTVTDRAALASAIREAGVQGYAIAEDQVLQGQIGAAVLLRTASGPAASISVRASSLTHPPGRMRDEIVPLLQRAAYGIAGI